MTWAQSSWPQYGHIPLATRCSMRGSCRTNTSTLARMRCGYAGRNSDVKYAQRLAFSGTAERQKGHSRVVGATAGAGRRILLIWRSVTKITNARTCAEMKGARRARVLCEAEPLPCRQRLALPPTPSLATPREFTWTQDVVIFSFPESQRAPESITQGVDRCHVTHDRAASSKILHVRQS